jgi:hypothetical protein
MDPAQMKARCPSHHVLGVAYLADHELCFPRFSKKRKSGTAGIAKVAGKCVWGVLYEVNQEDLAELHKAEGYAVGRSAEKNSHDFGEIEVRRNGPDGPMVLAETYFARPDTSGAVPSPDYIGHLIRGAEHHGLPDSYVRRLHKVATG